MVKLLTGGDKVAARPLYKEFFEFFPTSKMWLAVNHKPVIKGGDHATWRRIRLIPFKVTISDAQQDHDLPDKLLGELPGIMAWAVRGCLDWLQNGLEVPPEVTKATQAYRDEMDILKDFIADCCQLDTPQQVSLKELFEVYSKWCETNDRDALGRNSFGKSIKERGFEQDRGQGGTRYWKGIGIK
jgi:putative DNA primase/helicase